MPIKRTAQGWDVSVCVNYRRLHRRLPASATTSDAKQLEAQLRLALGKKSPAVPGDPLITELMARYLQHAETLRGPGPAKYAALRVGRWCKGYRASEARKLAAAMVSDMTGHYRPATINKSLGTLKKALRMAWESDLTPANYGDHIKLLPENNVRTQTLTLDQIRQIADKASDNVRAAIWIATYTGLRRGEICAIQAGDISEQWITLRSGMTKTEKHRSIPIIAPLRPWLQFLPLKISTEGIESGFKIARRAAGMDWAKFHDLRRSCATAMLAAGVDMIVISKLLGHSSVKVTEARYAHLQLDRVRAGLEAAYAPAVTPKRRKAA